MFEFLLILGITIYFSYFSRVAGGGFQDLPLSLETWLITIPIGFIGYNVSDYNIWLGLLSFVTAFYGIRTGHGQYMDLGTWTKPHKEEELDFIVKLFWGKDPSLYGEHWPNPWRDMTGLIITGLMVTLGLAITLFYMELYLLAVIAILAGAAKGLAYHIGWAIRPNFRGEEILPTVSSATNIGELLRGTFLGFGLGIIFVFS